MWCLKCEHPMLGVAQLEVVSSDLVSSHLKPAHNSEGIENSATDTDREDVRRSSSLMSSHILLFFSFSSSLHFPFFLFLWFSSHVLFFSYFLRSSFLVQPVSLFLLFPTSFRFFRVFVSFSRFLDFPCYRFSVSLLSLSLLLLLPLFCFFSFFSRFFFFSLSLYGQSAFQVICVVLSDDRGCLRESLQHVKFRWANHMGCEPMVP